MSKPWPMVPLGEVLSKSNEWINLKADATYREVTVKLWGKGVVLRREVAGAEIAATRRMLVRTNQLILSRIDARNGAAGIIPPALDGAVVSNDFPVFNLNTDRVEPEYFGWLTKTKDFVALCKAASEGTTNRVRLQEERFLLTQIPLPPLSEQKRLVARIEELAAKVEEARGLRRYTVNDAISLFQNETASIFKHLQKKYKTRNFNSFNPFITSGPRNWGQYYNESGFRFYRAQDISPNSEILQTSKVFVNPPSGKQGRSAMLLLGDLMLVITGATVGRCALYRENLEPGLVSQHVAICRLPKDIINPDFVLKWLNCPQGQTQLLGSRYGQGKPGLNLSNISSLSLPTPSISEQHRVVAYIDSLQVKVDSLKRLQAETSAELDAMLPAILDMAFKGGWRTRESLSYISSVQNEKLGTTLKKPSSKALMAEFPEMEMVYPANDKDRAVCAAALAIVECSGTISSMEHLDALFLVTHPDMCKNLLGQKESRALSTAMKSAPKELFVSKGQPIRWKECRDYLEELGAITIARGAHDQFIHAGTAFASIKAGLPAGTDGVVKYALEAVEHVRERRKNLESVPQGQRKALRVLDRYHEENKIPA